jgi:hypothetical protein
MTCFFSLLIVELITEFFDKLFFIIENHRPELIMRYISTRWDSKAGTAALSFEEVVFSSFHSDGGIMVHRLMMNECCASLTQLTPNHISDSSPVT